MKRFRFGLQKVLDLRQYREQEAKIELGKAIGILIAIENNIKRNAVIRHQAVQQRFIGINTSGHAGNNGAASMLAWDSYINRLEQEAERLMREAAQAEMVVEEKRNLYLEASRELKVMEKLKERRGKEHRKEMFAAETRELDDVRRVKP
jgi:flagellar FliJ protein